MLTKKLNSVHNLVTREAFGEVLLHKNVRTLLFSQGTNSDTKKSQELTQQLKPKSGTKSSS